MFFVCYDFKNCLMKIIESNFYKIEKKYCVVISYFYDVNLK